MTIWVWRRGRLTDYTSCKYLDNIIILMAVSKMNRHRHGHYVNEACCASTNNKNIKVY